MAAHADAGVSIVCVATDGRDGPSCGAASSSGCCGTLKYALESIVPATAAADPSASLIISLAPGVYPSSSCSAIASVSVAIVGAGMDATVVDCESQSRALVVEGPSANVSLSHLTIRNGFWREMGLAGGGGCVYVNWVPPEGQGYEGSPTFVMDSVRVLNCTTVSHSAVWLVGGGVGVFVNGDMATVGATLSVANCAFADNVVESSVGAAAIGGGIGFLTNSSSLMDGTTVFVANSTFFRNDALAGRTVNDDGGGIAVVNFAAGEMRNAVTVVEGVESAENYGN